MTQQTQEQSGELKSIGYELFIAALSILSIFNILVRFVVKDESLEYVIFIMNAIMTPIFLGDFLYRFFTAKSKSRYFWRDFGWADLFSSLPFPNAKILRVFRLWRVFRLFRRFGARNLLDQFITRRAENALLTVIFLVLCVLEFGALAVLRAEMTSPDASIHHGRVRRPLSRLQRRPRRRCAGDDRRRGLVRHPERFPGQPVPASTGAERAGRGGGRAGRAAGCRARRCAGPE